MLLSLSQWLQALYPEQLGFLRVFQYLTFRAVLAAMTALLIGLAFGPWVIRRLAEMKIGQPIREPIPKRRMSLRGSVRRSVAPSLHRGPESRRAPRGRRASR